MSSLLIQDLYQVNPSSSKTDSLIVNNSSWFSTLTSLNISIIVLNISLFILIWNFFISFFYIADFFYYYKIENEDNFEIEEKSINRLYLAMRIWITTVPSLIMVVLAIFFSSNQLVFFSLAILFYIFKIIYDLRLFGRVTEYFNWYNNIFTNLKKLRLK